ncbi:popeye domain-containing protein 3-like [Chiloscyllium plagiosum]|uniref:popeye domain-containing protein 3-like n=1 Tax=Chiloscyllium plagiosum TaxID=36176 RepID=UPI001CB81673|nr:popeye domain-containing protein 3-like [Chiloscyllium plagiosum]XP_043545825.1 popeye domain-containing protein 3-like [Chiloscyllium plagiosum]XP_043557500.1 popeye domain-containing protein 3-like [Chiloscyllium plagiosum]
MFRENSSFIETILYDSPGCKILKNGSEGAIYHLANVMFTLGYMSGSGFFGLVYLFSLLGVGFFIQSLWGWVDACGVDIFMWSLLLFVFCLVQLAHIGYRLRKVNFEEDFTNLYKAMFQPLDVPLGVYKEIVNCCDAEVTSLSREQNYAVEGKTAIDRLSLLLSGRSVAASARNRTVSNIYTGGGGGLVCSFVWWDVTDTNTSRIAFNSMLCCNVISFVKYSS